VRLLADVPTRHRVGCVVYAVVGSLAVTFFLFGAALGHCPVDDAGRGCEYDDLVKFAMFPGSLILFLVGGVWLARHVLRDRD